jgi:hypothetical protein
MVFFDFGCPRDFRRHRYRCTLVALRQRARPMNARRPLKKPPRLHWSAGSMGLESNATGIASFNPRMTDTLVRVGINYKFGPKFAVLANY